MSSAPAPDEGRVGDEDGLGGTHGERGAQAAGLVVGGHRHEGDLSAAGLVDQLEGHLDAVAVGLVEDELSAAVQRVVTFELAGLGGIGDLLHADDDVHGGHRRRRAPRFQPGAATVALG